jgi:hypothetical protein
MSGSVYAVAHKPHVRASDADRERVVEQLRRAAAEGRLAIDELEERVALALSAKTYSDLQALTADLPKAGASSSSRLPAEKSRSGGWLGNGVEALLIVLGGGAIVAAALSVIGASLWMLPIAVIVVAALGGFSIPRFSS